MHFKTDFRKFRQHFFVRVGVFYVTLRKCMAVEIKMHINLIYVSIDKGDLDD